MAGSSKSGYGKEWKGPIRAWKGSDWGNEALLDLKACKTKSYLRGWLCANLLCSQYYMHQQPSLAMWKKGVSEECWSPQSWRQSGFSDAVYQRHLTEEWAQMEEEEHEDSDEMEKVVIEEVASSEEETAAWKKQQEVPAEEGDAARAGYQWAVKEKKAAELLSASIKMEKSADVPLETKSYYAKWALQEAQGRDQAQEKAKVLGKSAEDFKELATLHPWRAGGKERQQEEKNENEKNENEKNENEKNENEKNENEKNEKNEQPAVVATQQDAFESWQRSYWGTGAWARDQGWEEEPAKGKKNKRRKRKAWLEAQIDSLKVNGRWVGPGHPSAVAKAIRLAKDCLERSH